MLPGHLHPLRGGLGYCRWHRSLVAYIADEDCPVSAEELAFLPQAGMCLPNSQSIRQH